MELRINPTSGLANRLRALGCAMWLADLMDRDLVLGWIRYAGMKAEFNQLFKTEFDIHPRPGWKLHYWGDFLNDPYLALESDIEHIQISTNRVFSYKGGPEVWSQEMWREVCPYIRSLSPIDEIQAVVSEFEEKHNIKDKVGIHIRRTDNVKSKEYSKLEHFYAEMDETSKDFFICSDCEETKQEVMDKYKERCVTFKHPSKKCPNTRKSVRGIERGLSELLLLGRTLKIIGSVHSSFGTMASVVGGAPIKRVGDKSIPELNVFIDDKYKTWDGSESVR